MREMTESQHGNTIAFGLLFVTGILAGVFLTGTIKSFLWNETDFFEGDVFLLAKEAEVDKKALFLFVLQRRAQAFLPLAVMATTYLGCVYCVFFTFRYGLAAGIYFSLLNSKFGAKGIFLGFAGMFPQYLFYLPAYAILLLWCENIYRFIYIQKSAGESILKSKRFLFRNLVQLFGIFLLFLAGCLAESGVNPGVLTAAMKKM